MSSKAKIYLYKEGNECESITGGWSLSNSNIINIDNIFTFTASNLIARGSACTSNVINFSRFNKIFFTDLVGNLTGVPTGGYVRIESVKHPTDNASLIKLFEILNGNNNAINYKFINFDINDVNGEYYLHLMKGSSSAGPSSLSLSFSSMYLETKESVITINSQDSSVIKFNCNTFDNLITITKAEVYINNQLSKTYNDNFDNITYNIDKNLCTSGANNIKIEVTYSQGDDIYEIVEEVLTHIDKLPTSSSLKELIDRQELLTNSIEVQKNNLKNILESKNVEVSEGENKLSILIDKVEELKEDDSIAWLFKDGNEKVSFEILGNGITINKFNFVGSGACSSKKVSVNTIDLTEYKMLKVEYGDCTTIKGNYYPVIGFGIATTKQTGDNHLASKTSNASSSQFNNANLISSLDISSFNGNYYIDIFANCYASASLNINIKNIWLEK